MKNFAKIISVLMCTFIIVFSLVSCKNKNTDEKDTLTIAYQGGIGYAPVHILEAKKIIENNCNDEIKVEFVKLDSGAAINEGIIGGTIDIGCMGLGPAVSGVSSGIPYKVISNLCSQSHGLMSRSPEITSLKDITSKDKIALVSTGSFQHILLAMAAEKSLGDAHALDNNIQGMSHSEGMAALESGTVQLHLTSSPFIYQERTKENYNELSEISEVWPSGSSFLVAMAAESLSKNEQLFDAVSKSFEEAITFINENPDETAQIETEYLGLDLETVKSYLAEEDCQFFSELRGAEEMTSFMYRAGFIEKEVSIDDFKYDAVKSK